MLGRAGQQGGRGLLPARSAQSASMQGAGVGVPSARSIILLAPLGCQPKLASMHRERSRCKGSCTAARRVTAQRGGTAEASRQLSWRRALKAQLQASALHFRSFQATLLALPPPCTFPWHPRPSPPSSKVACSGPSLSLPAMERMSSGAADEQALEEQRALALRAHLQRESPSAPPLNGGGGGQVALQIGGTSHLDDAIEPLSGECWARGCRGATGGLAPAGR